MLSDINVLKGSSSDYRYLMPGQASKAMSTKKKKATINIYADLDSEVGRPGLRIVGVGCPYGRFTLIHLCAKQQ